MKHDLLKECLDTLIQVRALKHNELDPSVTAELDSVISKITVLLDAADQTVVVDRGQTERILTAIGRVAVSLDWIHQMGKRFLE